MLRYLTALIAGILFGVGLTVSQMVNPQKVIGFLDVFGQWDPSLAFVMGGALIVTTLGYRFAFSQSQPLSESSFQIPVNRQINGRLVIGSVIFGMGWGAVGLCPGPAIAALTLGGLPVIAFFIAMGAGMVFYEVVNNRIAPSLDTTSDNAGTPSAT